MLTSTHEVERSLRVSEPPITLPSTGFESAASVTRGPPLEFCPHLLYASLEDWPSEPNFTQRVSKCPAGAMYSASPTETVSEVNAYKKQPMISLLFLFWFTELENQRTLQFEKTWEVLWSNFGHSEDVTAITESRGKMIILWKGYPLIAREALEGEQWKWCPWLAFNKPS